MKRLGIFGDSFARVITDSPMFPQGDKGWAAILQNEDPANVDVYAKGGVCLEWIVEQFLQHHTNYEQVVVVITSWPRLHFPIELTPKNNDPKWISECWANAGMIEDVIKKNNSPNNILQKILDWMVWIAADPSQQWYQQNNIIANCAYLKHLRPDVILLPIMKHRGFDTVEPGYNWCLRDISVHETKLIGDPFGFTKNWKQDFRPNHMSIENNQWVLNHVKERLRGNFIPWEESVCHQYKNKEELGRLNSK